MATRVTCRVGPSSVPGALTVTPWRCDVVDAPEHVKKALEGGTRGSSIENAVGNVVSLLAFRFPGEEFDIILQEE